jgi:superfamily II DNA or RNA helicase
MKLAINNSASSVSDFTQEQFRVLKNVLSYSISDNAAFYGGLKYGNKRYLLDKKGNFPTGLLPLVLKTAKTHKWALTQHDLRQVPEACPKLFNLSLGLTPYPEQIEAVEAFEKAHRGTISMPTGTGKSVTMALLINAINVPTLVVVPTLGLKQQLTQTFTHLFGNMNNITVENIDSPNLEKPHKYGMLIIDEAHHVAAATYRRLNQKVWTNIYYRAYFTATPFRSRDEEQLLMESVAGQVIYELDYQTSVDKGYIAPVEAYYIELPKRNVEGYTWAQVYKELVTNNKPRNDLIASLLDRLEMKRTSTLCLVKEIAHGTALAKATDHNPAFANGIDAMSRQYILEFCLQERNVLIGTTGVLGEGVDTKPAEYVIIAGLGKSRPQFMQQVGRGVRTYKGKESCKVILIKDPSHKWTLTHFKAQCKVLLDEYGIKPIKLEI